MFETFLSNLCFNLHKIKFNRMIKFEKSQFKKLCNSYLRRYFNSSSFNNMLISKIFKITVNA
jgi:hypothetical protein